MLIFLFPILILNAYIVHFSPKVYHVLCCDEIRTYLKRDYENSVNIGNTKIGNMSYDRVELCYKLNTLQRYPNGACLSFNIVFGEEKYEMVGMQKDEVIFISGLNKF